MSHITVRTDAHPSSGGNRADEPIFTARPLTGQAESAPVAHPQRPSRQDAANRPAARTAREAWREQLIVENYPLVQRIARQVYGRLPKNVELDDLVSAGTIGLIDAAERFEASREVPFKAFARPRIRGAMYDGLRSDDWVPSGVRRRAEALRQTREDLHRTLGESPDREQMASAMALSPEQLDRLEAGARVLTLLSMETPLGDEGDRTVGSTLATDRDLVDLISTTEQSDAMAAALARLPDRERDAVKLYYLDGMTLEEVGEALGVTLSRAYQLRTRGVERIRYCMQRHLAC